MTVRGQSLFGENLHCSPLTPWSQRPQNLTRLFSDVDMRLYQSEQLVLQKRAARQKP
jgi:hypothetical protein